MVASSEGYIGYVISDVARLMRMVFDRRVRELGLTRAQWLVMTRLYRRPGASRARAGAGDGAVSRLRRFVLRLVLLVGVPLAVAMGGFAVWLHGGRYVNTENAYVKADIAQVAPEVAGRVIEVAVRNYLPVTAGQLLFRLDAEPYQLALERAEAELDGARAQVETLRASVR